MDITVRTVFVMLKNKLDDCEIYLWTWTAYSVDRKHT